MILQMIISTISRLNWGPVSWRLQTQLKLDAKQTPRWEHMLEGILSMQVILVEIGPGYWQLDFSGDGNLLFTGIF